MQLHSVTQNSWENQMKNINKQEQPAKGTVAAGKQRNYNEIVEFLDNHWNLTDTHEHVSCIKKLDQAFDTPSQKIPTILVAGTNGKSLTINFTAQLLKEEGLTVGAFYSPHILTYNERFILNKEAISNKIFTELGNEVINTAEAIGITPNSSELLTIMALLYFERNAVDVALLEVEEGPIKQAVTICTPKITAITRVTPDKISQSDTKKGVPTEAIATMLDIVKQNTHVICADQSKLNLQVMFDIAQEKGAVWSMPIRKLAPLDYPYEQLHGRCAALGERIAHIYINTFAHKDAIVVTGTLLTKQKGQRGRPTLEAKRHSELNPKKTVEQFWKDAHSSLPGRFQLLDKEKPTLLLDSARNLDAFKNLLLGVRLLHYQRPLKGLTLIIGFDNPDININELLKLLRYFFKKTSGNVIIYPAAPLPGQATDKSLDLEKITNDIKSMKIKAKLSTNFKEAFELAQKNVDNRHGLVVVTGSSAAITEYWRYKSIKKL